MGKDTSKALKLVKKSKEVQKPLVEKHQGTWLKEMGDGAMAKFNTALDAVNCALEIQELAQAKFDGKLRIGIHSGDITIENNDVYGDGVNVASRLESIADPGGIYISDAIEKAIRGQTNVQAKYLGEVNLKNVDYGVRTYALQGVDLPVPEVKDEKELSGHFWAEVQRRGVIQAAISYLVVALLSMLLWGQVQDWGLNFPPWSFGLLLTVLGIGFPLALYLAWSYEKSPEGFVKTTSKQSWQNPLKSSQRKPFTGSFVIVGLVLVIVFMYFYPSFQHSDKVQQSSETILESSVIDKSIAVLPFKNQSAEEDNQYFADGVMDAILNKLSKIEELRVTSSTSVEKFRNTIKTIPEIATELNVTHILVGSAQKYGQEIKITIQLINTVSDAQVWSQDYTRTFEDVLYLEGEIAEKVALEMKAALSIEERDDLRELPTKSAEAYNYFLLADFQSNKNIKEGYTNAISLFEKSIEIDRDFVEAYIKLAKVWIRGGLLGVYEQKVAWSKAKKLFIKSLELKPKGEAYNLLAIGYFYYEWNFEKADEYFNRGKEITGNESDWSPDFYLKIGEFEKALVASEDNIELLPLNSWYYATKAAAKYFLGRKTEAVQTLDEAYRLFDDFVLLSECARWYYLFNEIDKSISTLAKLKNNFPDRPSRIYWLEAVHALHEGRDVQVYIDQLEERYNNNSGNPAWFIALFYAAAQDEDAVFEWLEKSYDRHEVEMTWLKMEPALDPYKNDSRYLDLLGRMNFPE